MSQIKPNEQIEEERQDSELTQVTPTPSPTTDQSESWILIKKSEPDQTILFGNQPPREKKQGICFQWQESRTCSYKSSCIFQHPTEEQMNQMKEQERNKPRPFGGEFKPRNAFEGMSPTPEICKFFLKRICNKGKECRFSHAINDDQNFIVSESSTLKRKFFGEVKQLSNVQIQPHQFTVPKIENFQKDQFQIENFSICLQPAVTILNDQEIILIRHGLSLYNYSASSFYYQTGFDHKSDEARAYMLNQDLIDSPLYPYGVEQAINQQPAINKIDFDTVFVSPLRRAIETCYHLFNKHPNVDQINFIVEPLCSEVLSKICDISCFSPKELQAYSAKFAPIKFDFSLFKSKNNEFRELWQIQNIARDRVYQDIRKKYLNRKSNESLISIIKDRMAEIFPQPVEQYQSVHTRAEQMKQDLKNFISDKNLRQTGKQVGIVSHSTFFKNFTAQNLSSTGNVIGALNLDNCEIASYRIP